MLTTRAKMTVEWVVPLGQIASITSAVHSLATETRAAPGCLGCSVSTVLGGHGTVRYVEEWRTEADLRRQLQSETFTQLAGLLEVGIEPPLVQFELPGRKRGFDYVEEVRRLAS
jgi:quinol monooxygenase YgiN